MYAHIRRYAREDIERHTTPAYRAPEQVDLHTGKLIGVKVDAWACGVLLYKLCCFRTPFEDVKTGSLSNMAILNASYKFPPPDAQLFGWKYSQGLEEMIAFCLVPEVERRPNIEQIYKKLHELMDDGKVLRVDLSTVSCSPTVVRGVSRSGTTGLDESMSSSSRRGEGGKKEKVGMFTRAFMGGEKGIKKNWIVKATSKEPGPPKAKYVRKIILAMWEEKMTVATLFVNVCSRPIHTNPVVAIKALISIMKVLQQGPPVMLPEFIHCVSVIEELGR